MNEKPSKSMKSDNATEEKLLNLDKSDLVTKILQLEAHNRQLKNVIKKHMSEDAGSELNKKKKPFNFSNCHYRKVLLQILYFGWDYHGLAVQEDSNQTIEHHLFNALTKSCLIEQRETSHYHRCGRTDKGVSSFGQVISIKLRSKHPPDQQITEDGMKNEIQYCKILNRLLPKDIRAVAWMPIPEDRPEYSARFDCEKRQYKYYFPRSSLNIPNMRLACAKLIGNHDFRNLCKMDVANGVVEFRRDILKADVLAVEEKDSESPTSMYYLLIEGNAFLWHQIRCIMGVLLLVGEGKENPEIITELLNVDQNPRKPQYNMALDIPLNLFHCTYDLDKKWIYEKDELKHIISQIQGEWAIHSIKTTMIRDVLSELEKRYAMCASETDNTDMTESERDRVMSHTACLTQGVKPKVYTPLLKRQTCSSLEERKEYYSKKKKLSNDKESID